MNNEVQFSEHKDDDGELFDLKSLEEKEDLVNEIWDNLSRARDHASVWRQRAYEEERFYAGDQWSEDDRNKLLAESRPVITFNRTLKIINAISGMELQNRQEAQYLPTEKDDAGFADVMNSAARWIRSRCDAEDEESDAFLDLIKIGMGWIETRIDYEVDLDGQVFVERISPFDMVWDADSCKQNLTDARWLARVKKMSLRQFKEFYPDQEPEIGEFWQGHDMYSHDATQEFAYKYKDDNGDNINKANIVSVIQYQYWIREEVYRYTDVDGEIKTATREQFNKIKPILDAQNINYVKQYRRVYKQVFLNGRNILDHGDCPVNSFTFSPMTGLYDRHINQWFGIMRLLIDPQMWSNKWLSQLLDIINSNAKGGVFAEENAFRSPRQAMSDWAKPSPIIMLQPGGLQKIRERQPPSYPASLDRIFEYSIQAFQDVTGVNAEMLGLVDREQAGILEIQRKESVYGQLQGFFKALRRYRKDQGRVLADFIQKFIATEDGSQLVRIVGDEGFKFVPLLKDQVALKYDITIGDAPTAPNQRERTASTIMKLIPMAQSADIPVPVEVLDYMPIPQSLVEKWKEKIAEAAEPDPEQEQLKQMLQQIDLELAQINLERQNLKNMELQSDIELNKAKAYSEIAKAQDYEQDNSQGEAQSLINFYEVEREQSRKDAEAILKARREMLTSFIR